MGAEDCGVADCIIGANANANATPIIILTLIRCLSPRPCPCPRPRPRPCCYFTDCVNGDGGWHSV